MTRRKQGNFELIASMPWWAGVALGLLGYFVLRYGMGWYLESSHNPVISGMGRMLANGVYAPFAWMFLIACWLAAIGSFIGRARRRDLLDSQTGIDSLRHMSWRQFEQLAGAAFRRQGYVVEETGLGGADGGIDLILRKSGKTTLVQCKQWRNRQVGVRVVREMYGLLVDQQAAAVKIVALGDYTPDAHRFAQGKPIELIHGGALISIVRSLQTRKTKVTGPMDSPLALSGSMLASLLLIAVLSSATASAPSLPKPPSATFQSAPQPTRTSIHPITATPQPHPQATIYMSNLQNDAQLREWKKKNAASMKILEKTTKEMPLR